MKWIEATGSLLEPEGELTMEFYHIMVTAYFEGVFEVVRHGMGLDDAKKYAAMMGKYHHAASLQLSGNRLRKIKLLFRLLIPRFSGLKIN